MVQQRMVLTTLMPAAVAGWPQRTNLALPRCTRDMTDRRASTVLSTSTVKILRQAGCEAPSASVGVGRLPRIHPRLSVVGGWATARRIGADQASGGRAPEAS